MATTHETTKKALNMDRERVLPFTKGDFRGESLAVLGKKGSGKSTTVQVLVEELLEGPVPFPLVLIDPQDEYYGLTERYDILVVGRSPHASVPLDPLKAGALAEFSLTRGIPLILSLYGYSEEERFTLLASFFKRLWVLEEQMKKPYMVICEEAHKYLPQQGKTPVSDILADIFLLGRKYGLGTILATQRSAKIHKDTISQSGIFVLHKVTYPTDLDVYKDLLPLPPKQVEAMVRRLRKGGAIVMYEDDSLPEEVANEVIVPVQIRKQHTFHAGATPDFATVESPSLRQLDERLLRELQQLLAEAVPDVVTEESELHKRVRMLEKEIQEKDASNTHLQEEILLKQRTVESLESQLHLASQLTVSLTGVPALESLFSDLHSFRVEQAHVDQVTLGGGGGGSKKPDSESENSPLMTTVQQMRTAIDALVTRLQHLAQQDEETQRLRKSLAHLAQQDKSKGTSTQVTRGMSDQVLHPRERRRLETLIGTIQRLHHASFQCALLSLLLQHEGQALSYGDIAAKLRYAVETVRHTTTTGLRKEGLIAKVSDAPGYVSQFSDYCKNHFPGASEQVIREYLLQALVPLAEGKGA